MRKSKLVRITCISLLVLLAGSLAASGYASALPAKTRSSADTFLVKFKSRVTVADQRFINAKHGVSEQDSIAKLDVHVLKTPPDKSAAGMVEAYRRLPSVEFAEPNFLASAALTADDPYFSLEWHLAKIEAPSAWDVTTGSDSLIIAVVDSGVDFNHPDLAARLTSGYDFVNKDSDPSDDNGHGTAVAGTAGAVTNNAAGVAAITWAARLMPVKVLGSDAYGTYSNIAKGIIYAADNGADVINLSLAGSSPSSTLKSAVDYAASKGALPVAAAGNSGGEVMYPAAYDSVVAVGATDSSDNKATFSSYGPQLDVTAPGVGIYTTTKSGYATRSGTSFAAPLAGGLATLIWAQNPAWSAAEVRARLENTVDDLGEPGRDDLFGFGRINAAKALGSGPVADVVPPSVSITNPVGGTTVSGIVSVAAEAGDNVGVDRVEFLVDGQAAGADNSAPHSLAWDSTAVQGGDHTIVARAVDRSGNKAEAAVTVKVDNPSISSGDSVGDSVVFSGSVGGRNGQSKSYDINAGGVGTLAANLSWGGKAALDLYLVDGAGAILAKASGAKPEIINFDLPAAGSYRLVVTAVSGKANFTLNVTTP